MKSTVFVVDDDPAVRESLGWLIRSAGLVVETFASGEEFLDRYAPAMKGCLVLDIAMPGMSGLELQQRLKAQGIRIPIVFVTGRGDVPMAVLAMKSGAADFLEKPYDDEQLLAIIRCALEQNSGDRAHLSERSEILARLGTLTPREREVFDGVVDGRSNKEVGCSLGINHKTVEAHRRSMMHKMRVDRLAELVRLAVIARSGDP